MFVIKYCFINFTFLVEAYRFSGTLYICVFVVKLQVMEQQLNKTESLLSEGVHSHA